MSKVLYELDGDTVRGDNVVGWPEGVSLFRKETRLTQPLAPATGVVLYENGTKSIVATVVALRYVDADNMHIMVLEMSGDNFDAEYFGNPHNGWKGSLT